MNDQTLKKKAASGFAYRFAERVLARGISFVLQLILARLLMPEEYGLVALVTVLITICDVFVTYGFGNALVWISPPAFISASRSPPCCI